jgi:FAD/FMN-containing dehydrogenase
VQSAASEIMANKKRRYESWGRYPPARHKQVVSLENLGRQLSFSQYQDSVLPYGQGRSYGDTCLNNGAILIDTSSLSGILEFDTQRGILRCSAGTTLSEVLDVIVPSGWFLPVTPGTKYVSIGGAIAHDVHGKNHHRAGTLGCHVERFELLRSSGERLICSSRDNSELFRATISGMGLTGLILWAEIKLHAIPGPFISVERLLFTSLEQYCSLAASSEQDHEYSVAWLDIGMRGDKPLRGILTRGHYTHECATSRSIPGLRLNRVPFATPDFLFNQRIIRAINSAYFRSQSLQPEKQVVHYDPFFYPLDAVPNWNRVYRHGFLQYQFVVPFAEREAIEEILSRIGRSGLTAVLGVLKNFGDVPSPGMLSFPRPGITLALDFPFLGIRTLKLLDELDQVTLKAGGAVYPAKDARMSAESFQTYFPQWRTFSRYIDPKFSSSFWRRVTAG